MLEGVSKVQISPVVHPALDEAQERDAYVRGEATESGSRLYVGAPLMPDGQGEDELASLLAMRTGASLVMRAMVIEHGRENVLPVFRNVRDEVRQTENRNIQERMTLGDVELIHQQLRRPDPL